MNSQERNSMLGWVFNYKLVYIFCHVEYFKERCQDPLNQLHDGPKLYSAVEPINWKQANMYWTSNTLGFVWCYGPFLWGWNLMIWGTKFCKVWTICSMCATKVPIKWENGNVAQALGLFLIPPGCFWDQCSILPLVNSAVLALLVSSLQVHACNTPGGQTEAACCSAARVFIFLPFPVCLYLLNSCI